MIWRAGSRNWRACATTCGASCAWATSSGWAHCRLKPAKGPVRLALAGETLYLAAGNLYELDSEEGRLVTLLAHGDDVGGGSAGDIRHVSIDGGDVVASDGAATYVRDELGRWQRRPLAVAEGDELRPDAPVITWGDAAYGLSRDGDLVRFDQAPVARAWTSGRLSRTSPIW